MDPTARPQPCRAQGVKKPGAAGQQGRVLSRFCLREWCLGPESNRHAAKRQILSLLCLPVPPPRHARKVRIIDDEWQENEFFVCARRAAVPSHLVNRSAALVVCLEVGGRSAPDRVVDADFDRVCARGIDGCLHRDGTPYPAPWPARRRCSAPVRLARCAAVQRQAASRRPRPARQYRQTARPGRTGGPAGQWRANPAPASPCTRPAGAHGCGRSSWS
jgi:hypothetical protein